MSVRRGRTCPPGLCDSYSESHNKIREGEPHKLAPGILPPTLNPDPKLYPRPRASQPRSEHPPPEHLNTGPKFHPAENLLTYILQIQAPYLTNPVLLATTFLYFLGKVPKYGLRH